MGKSKRTSNFLERIRLYNPTNSISTDAYVTINVETLKINSLYSLEKEFIELTHMNPLMVIILSCQSS